MLKNMPEGLLERLESMLSPRASALQTATWLKSPFPANTWILRFGEHTRTIDWSVPFGKGRLTDKPHEKILETFKLMLTGRAHPASMRGRVLDVLTTKQLVYRACRFVDFFLLQKDRFKLDRYGFTLVTEADFDDLLFRCAVGPTDEEVVYRWSELLAEWLDKRVHEHQNEVQLLLERHKVFSEIPIPEEDWTLTADDQQLASWRAVLWLLGMYRIPGSHDYRYIPSVTKLSQIIYADTIFGHGKKSVHDELCLYPVDRYRRECRGVDVRTIERDRPSMKYVEMWRATILSLSTLATAGVDLPFDAVEAIREKDSSRYEANTPGRYRNPPVWQVLDGIKNGVEFALDHGEALLQSYVNLIGAAKAENISINALVRKRDIRQYMTKGALNMGVSTFCVRQEATNWPHRFEGCNSRWTPSKFFDDLRNGCGLLQNIHVFYGSLIHVIGAVTARRQIELLKLPVSGCLDSTRAYMVFRNAKSGANGVRQEELRPIPPIVEQMVSLVESFHSSLIQVGALTDFGALLSTPGHYGMRASCVSAFNLALDVFCDFFSTALDDNGRRHYLREHQLRRFLIITFFFAARKGSLNTLRWFVGHVDAAHLWNYLSNSVSGDMKREAAAYFLMDELRLPEEQQIIELHEQVRRELSDFAEAQFGTRNFSLIDADALEDYLNLQLKKGLVVEPVFLSGTGECQYKIVARLRRMQ
ncbi:hypothetical protein VSR82_13970 [Burkholderia sp. JPY481]